MTAGQIERALFTLAERMGSEYAGAVPIRK
jgi:hypothetical protein